MTPTESVAVVDLAAISANVARMIAVSDGALVMTVVKANAYGHGAVPVARAAIEAGAHWLGVADIDEAIELREAGIDAPVLAWLHPSTANFEQALRAGIVIAVSDLDQLLAVAQAQDALGLGPAPVHLKLDTGLGRNGADEPNWPTLFDEARRLEQDGSLRVHGIFSHLSNADDVEDLRQLERLHEGLALAQAAGLRPRFRHLASTAGALRLPSTRLDLVRVGIGSYGLSPLDGANSQALGLCPAMTLTSTIVSVAPSSGAGDSARSGIVPLGYADGIPLQAAGRVQITADNGPLLVTRVESDHLVVEPLASGDDPIRGDRVTLFGDPAAGHTSVDDWARAALTINYEIVTRLSARVPRRYIS